MIIISPFSRKLLNGKENAKNFPWWYVVVNTLRQKGFKTIQIGIEGEQSIKADVFMKNTPLKDLEVLIKECETWISVDNFFPHLCELYHKPGVVIFSKSNPEIFGYPSNINLLKSQNYLRKNQFDIWETEEFETEAFVSSDEVISVVLQKMQNVPVKDY